jgi:hypothetical protein
MLVDVIDDHLDGRSSSAAKKADADFKIAFARRARGSPARALLIRAASSLEVPGFALVDVGLLHPRPQRLDADPELVRDPLHRPVIGAQLLAQLADRRTARSFSVSL